MKPLFPRLLGLLCALTLLLPAALAAPPNGTVEGVYFTPDHSGARPLKGAAVALSLDGRPLTDPVPAVLWQGRTLVPVRLVGEALGIQVTWLDQTNQVILQGTGSPITLTLGSPTALVGETPVPLPDAVPPILLQVGSQVRTMVPLRFVSETLGCTVAWDAAACAAHLTSPARTDQPTVVLDPGHGGTATGAAYGGVAEKTVNLAVTLKVERLLTQAGLHVILTRSTDQDIGLYDRAALANRAEADLFLSIHANASDTNLQAQGASTYSYPGSVAGAALAAALQRAVLAATGAGDMGLHTANFVVLRETSMPAALVELGFLSTPAERLKLTDPAYQDKLARGVAQGVLTYLGR